MVSIGEVARLPDLGPVSVPIREAEVEVIFGTPSRNCEGSGICMVTGRFPNGYTVSCPHAPAIIYCEQEREELVVRFQKRHLTEAVLKRLTESEMFLVEEPFCIPRQLVQRWGLPNRYIPAGRYPVEVYSKEYRLYLPWPRD
ncbi:MAG: hypothetical protein NZM43_09565 [Saprospiraceae bacterium]|nr:hypothetical protein [Saprospiraceae bacterium]MDW8484563.1 hypothetical protein [Saprospiraceae bacterium]